MTKRQIFEYQGTDFAGWDDGELSVMVTDGHVRVAVRQEKAVDSYNQFFECAAQLPLEKAREMARLLLAALGEER